MTAGERLRAWREASEKTQREVARDLGCSQAALTKLEADDAAPSVVLAVAIERLTAGAVTCEAWKKPDKKAAARPAEQSDESAPASSESGEHGLVDPDAPTGEHDAAAVRS